MKKKQTNKQTNKQKRTHTSQVVSTRSRIRHSRLAQNYLFTNEQKLEFIPSNCNYSLRHALIDCIYVADILRRQLFIHHW